MTLYSRLKRRDCVRVTFGRFGSQLAIVSHRTASGNLYACKLSAKRNRWTKPVRIWPEEIIELVRNEGELRNAPQLPLEYERHA